MTTGPARWICFFFAWHLACLLVVCFGFLVFGRVLGETVAEALVKSNGSEAIEDREVVNRSENKTLIVWLINPAIWRENFPTLTSQNGFGSFSAKVISATPALTLP